MPSASDGTLGWFPCKQGGSASRRLSGGNIASGGRVFVSESDVG